ncbi:MAG TPA: uroporphyrinogen decarboxylase family protein [Pyrinomonadaceae bacterium]|nr:uroporphyrinogen decarboxylase family protein [Pyrinomonadaceae bacterium]
MNSSAVTEQIGNARFQNALARRAQTTPPIWLMRQAGRYHKHYQTLRQKYSFMDLCKRPELAAEVALGPVLDFDFDAAILFSDLLFPLEALGMGLEYTDRGPQLGWNLDEKTLSRLRSIEDAWPHLLFQGEAMRATRERLPSDRSLIGFVGGPWTLFVYAVEGSHKGSLAESKKLLSLFPRFCEAIVPLLARNIELQLESGAEVVMIFDTAAGELSPDIFQAEVVRQLQTLTAKDASRIGYYSNGTQSAHLRDPLFTDGRLAGVGVDSGWDLSEAFDVFPNGFVQGNFDQALLLCDRNELKQHLIRYLEPLANQTRPGWICGLGHGVLPGTPEDNVRLFVDTVREVMQ